MRGCALASSAMLVDPVRMRSVVSTLPPHSIILSVLLRASPISSVTHTYTLPARAPPGLYSAFMGCIMYFLTGTSKDITIGQPTCRRHPC